MPLCRYCSPEPLRISGGGCLIRGGDKGSLTVSRRTEAIADGNLEVTEGRRGQMSVVEEGRLTARRFGQGAPTQADEYSCLIERVKTGRIGADPRSRLSQAGDQRKEKKPWKSSGSIEQRSKLNSSDLSSTWQSICRFASSYI